MAKTKNPELLRKKERVKNAVPLRGVPEGSEGRVMLAVGVDWQRYWVRFDNGMELGSLHRDHLVRVGEWDRYLVDREAAAERAAEAAETAAADGEGDAAEAAGDGGSVNGVAIPAHLLERSKNARARLGA